MRAPARGPTVPGRTSRVTDAVHARIEAIYREEYGRVVASLARRFGDLDIAEDAASEALVTALEKWPIDGIPPNPGGWLTTTAGNRAIDKIRREKLRDAKHEAADMIRDDTPHEPTGMVEDDRLRLIFTCCHPALAPEARVALTLRLLGGLTVDEIARAFLVAGDDDGPAHHPRQGEDQEPRTSRSPVPDAGRPHRAARRGARCPLPRLQRGLPGWQATTRSAPTSPTRRSGWPASCASCCPTSPRSPACSR